MRYHFIDRNRAQWPLSAMTRALEVSRQGYHAWKRKHATARQDRRQQLSDEVREVFDQSRGTYGSPRVTLVLRQRGHTVSRKTVKVLMRSQGLSATRKRRYRPTTDAGNSLAPAPNLVQRGFDVQEVDRVWLSDFIELPCRSGRVYAVAIMDLCSRRILGMIVSWSMQTRTLIAALDQACRLRGRLPDNPLVFHSDRGSQYNAITFRVELAKRNIVQSMSGAGNCYDNAPMESFWARMKHELRDEMLI